MITPYDNIRLAILTGEVLSLLMSAVTPEPFSTLWFLAFIAQLFAYFKTLDEV